MASLRFRPFPRCQGVLNLTPGMLKQVVAQCGPIKHSVVRPVPVPPAA